MNLKERLKYIQKKIQFIIHKQIKQIIFEQIQLVIYKEFKLYLSHFMKVPKFFMLKFN